MASSDGRKKSGVLSWVGRKLSRDEGEDGLGEGGKVNAEQLELKKEAGKGNNDGKEKKFGSKGEKAGRKLDRFPRIKWTVKLTKNL